MKTAVVILHFNRPGDVAESLRHMAALRAKHEFIVVDNGSSPANAAALTALPEMAGVRLIALPHNIGSCAWDFGAAATEAEIVIKLDDDSHLATASLEVLAARFAAEPDLGAIPLAVEGGPFPCPDRPAYRRGTSVGFIGCGVAFRKAALLRAGGHDPNFFIYADEWDLAVRLLSAGYEIDREASIRVVHRVAQTAGRTSPRLIVYTTRNEVLMARKYFRQTRYLRLIARIACRNLQRFRRTGGIRTVWYVLQGLALALCDRRVSTVPLPAPAALLARYEAWMFAFRPLFRRRRPPKPTAKAT
jgi:GT2 family glycosyltransferase